MDLSEKIGEIEIDQSVILLMKTKSFPVMKLFIFILLQLLFNLTVGQKQTGCVLWRNTFVKIENETNQILVFKVHSKQRTGWLSLGLFTSQTNFTSSTSIVAFHPENFLQLENHTKVQNKKTIFSEEMTNKLFDLIDGMMTYSFKMNASDLIGKNFFRFAINTAEPPTKIFNQTTYSIPKHSIISPDLYFDFNNREPIPICADNLDVPYRIFAFHPASFIIVSLIYVVIGCLFVTFRDEQPFKSRFIGPFIFLFAMYVNLCSEFLDTLITHELKSKYYCVIYPFLQYGSFQISFD
jgi:hypothetical protein